LQSGGLGGTVLGMRPVCLPGDVQATLYDGVAREACAPVAAGLLQKLGGDFAVVLACGPRELDQAADHLLFYTSELGFPADTLILPLPEHNIEEENPTKRFEAECDRLSTATALKNRAPGTPTFLIATPKSLLQPLPLPEALASRELQLRRGDNLSLTGLAKKLAEELSYDAEAVCETPGQFAVRGGLIDVYPLNGKFPVRLDFFGDELDSIRAYDPTTQRSTEELEAVVIAGSAPDKITRHAGALASYLPERVDWFLSQPDSMEQDYPNLFQTPEKMRLPHPTLQDLLDQRVGKPDSWHGLLDIDAAVALFPEGAGQVGCMADSLENFRPEISEQHVGTERVEAEQRAREQFLLQLLAWQREGRQVRVVTDNEGEEKRLREILSGDAKLRELEPLYVRGLVHRGVRLPAGELLPETIANCVYVTDGEIFGRYRLRISTLRRRATPSRARVDQLLDFSELVDGDFLVHLQHGVCIFRGLQTLDLGDHREEVITLEFAENVTLHLRLHESHLLNRYVGLAKVKPKLGKLGTNQWEKTRAAAERSTLDFAGELLSLQAKREQRIGHAFSPDQPWQKEFEESFLFTETPDQLRAINDTRADMEKPQPMDRLICGDVGFGKTEVALRAAFKAVMDGKQVAVLVPTTVLCQQHFQTFRERMADYPIVVEMLSRFRSPTQQRRIKQELKAGKIDIIIGTHALISKQVQFKELGMLVIDEEHRFGVKQKEKLKLFRESVDVLSMSATPIPRTLQFALMGIRDLSVIETPPRDRLPVQTIVKAYDPELVQRAIRFEVERGGQAFYLHNRVQTIHSVAADLQKRMPELRIAVGHGQMEEKELERLMTDFIDGRFDLLVCTTIIESGLDIPNCNTIIIEGADRFGLAQLYQIRGRVGRFNRQAYAYLLLHRHAGILDQARKRLSAIRQYNQLGAGFRIAMRDLELRGAGNLLGHQQSGHIAGVGFDLYCQLLRQSVAKIKGEADAGNIRATVKLDFVTVGEADADANDQPKETAVGYGALKEAEEAGRGIDRLEAYIPPTWLTEARLRIDTYRRLSMAATPEEVEEIRESLRDRFGKLPEPVETLVRLAQIRTTAEQKGVATVVTEGDKLKCQLASTGKAQFIQTAGRFPRLSARTPHKRLDEILSFLKNRVKAPQTPPES